MAEVIKNVEEWSEASKRSVEYMFPPHPYVDIEYLCWQCKAPAVFTAEDQKRTYEVQKAHRGQRRVLCVPCHAERCRLNREVLVCRRRWAEGMRELQRDIEFLRHWLAVLEAHDRYGARSDPANIIMLRRLVEQGPLRGA